jgi:enamine deaminase RidA (YjgF/YER057c/UK114 family)
MNSTRLDLTAKILVLMLGVLCAASPAQAQPQGGAYKVIKVEGRGAGPVSSDGLLAGKTLYLAAQDGRNSDGSLPASFSQEVAQALAHAREVLQAAGMDMGNLVWVQVYVTRPEDIAAMNDVYWKSIGASPPARTILVAANLPGGQKIQINAIAVAGNAKRQVITPAGWRQGRATDPRRHSGWMTFCISRRRAAPIRRPASCQPTMPPEVKQKPGQCRRRAEGGQHDTRQCGVDPIPTMASPDASGPQGPPAWIAHNGQPQQTRVTVMNKIYASYFEFGNTPGAALSRWQGCPLARASSTRRLPAPICPSANPSGPGTCRPAPPPVPASFTGTPIICPGKSGFIPGQGS